MKKKKNRPFLWWGGTLGPFPKRKQRQKVGKCGRVARRRAAPQRTGSSRASIATFLLSIVCLKNNYFKAGRERAVGGSRGNRLYFQPVPHGHPLPQHPDPPPRHPPAKTGPAARGAPGGAPPAWERVP